MSLEPRRVRIALLGGLALAVAVSRPWGEARAERTSPALEELRGRSDELRRRRSTPDGLIPLLGLMGSWDQVPVEAVERTIALGRDRRSHPLVRGYGTFLAAQAALRRGRRDEATRLRAEAGFIAHWLLCGPFDNTGRRGHAEVHPVEKELDRWPDLSRRYAGKEQSVSWRPIRAFVADAPVPVGNLLEPRREVSVYLQTLVATPKELPAALRLGTSGAYRVFLNGREVAAREVYRAPRPDQDAVGLRLARGVNRLALKLSVEDGVLDVYARLTAPDGGPLLGLRFHDAPPLGAQLAPPARGAVVRPVDPKALVRGALARKPKDPALLRDAALLEARLQPEETTAHAAEAAAERWAAAASTSEAYLHLAGVRRERDREREALEKAVALEPGNAVALSRLGDLRASDRRTLDAVSLWQRALQQTPSHFVARAKIAEALRGAGLVDLAARTLDELLAAHPGVGMLVRLRADLAQGRDDARRARELYERYLETHADDLSVRSALAELALRRGDEGAALAQHDASVDSSPHLVFVRLNRARALAGAGKLGPAIEDCQRALAIHPRSSRALEELGRLLLRAGRRAEARAAFEKALAVRPQNADLRAYLAFLAPGRGAGWAERYRVEPASTLRAALARPPRALEGASVLLDLTAVEVHQNGLSRTLHQRIVKIESAAGVREHVSFPIRFSPDRQAVEVKVARVHRADGSSEAASQGEVSLNEPWARLWYDTRAKVLGFASLRPGDLLEIEYLVEDVASDNLFADHFGDIAFLQEQSPIERFVYVLVTPAARRFFVREPRLRVERSEKVEEGRRVYRWEARGLPRIVSEPSMPGWSEVADYLHVSTYSRWEEMTRWYWGLVKEQLHSSKALVETARRVTASATSELEKIRAIQSYVARHTRYVGLEFGIHGYKPYASDQVLTRKFGDCKDKAGLLVALLREVGIPAMLVAVRTRDRGALDPSPASLAPFNHAIAYIPKHDLYLDGTAEFSGSTELPWQDQGVMALHIDPAGKIVLRQTPVQPARENLTRRQARWQLAAAGVKVNEELEIRGQAAARFRRRYQAADHRRQDYEKDWNSALGGARVVKVEMELDLERPVRIKAELQAQGLVRVEAGSRELSVRVGGGEEESLARGLGSLAARRHPLVLEHPSRHEQTFRLVPAPGYRFRTIPADATLATSFGRYARRSRLVGQELEVQKELELTQVRIAPKDYASFRSFLLQIDRLGGERVTLAR